MDVGFLGLGKLGLATALAVDFGAIRVLGCDPLRRPTSSARAALPTVRRASRQALAHTRL